jgi:aquaporin Z
MSKSQSVQGSRESAAKKLVAEFVGTTILVVIAVGVATLSFGYKLMGTSPAAGIVATALAFGLTLLALIYAIGATSGCHVNPAVTLGFLVSGRMRLGEAVGYWVAQFAGGIAGALILWGVFSGSPTYSRSAVGLGADGFGKASMIHVNATGAFATEVVLTFVFVFVVLSATSRLGSPGFAGMAIGLALATVHLLGIGIDGTSVNPARSLGPALIVGGPALSQIWVFLLAPLVGGAVAALLYRYFVTAEPTVADQDPDVLADRNTGRVSGTP